MLKFITLTRTFEQQYITTNYDNSDVVNGKTNKHTTHNSLIVTYKPVAFKGQLFNKFIKQTVVLC